MDRSPNTLTEGYRALVTNFPNGVLVLFDSEFRYQIVGPETLPFSGREASEMVGKTVFELFPEDTVSELAPEFEATIAGEACSFDTEYGERIHHIETKPVQIAGDSYGVMVTQEVTDERQTARKYEEQNQRLENFAGIVSHDLRNPLTIAQGHVDLARQEDDTMHLEAIETALDRMHRIITDVLWLASEGQDIGAVEPVDFVDAIDAAWAMVAEQTTNATLRVADDESQFPLIAADYDRLCQLLENVLGNAIEHGGDEVVVTVGVLADGFYIEDDGPGIPARNRDELFEPGYSTAVDGTGFGLHIVKQVVDAHGWNIRVTDGGDGGARFEFTDVTSVEG